MICSNERGLIPWILNDRSHSAKPWKIMVGSLVNLGRVIVEEGGEGRWIRILYTWQRKRERIVGVEYPCVCMCVCSSINLNQAPLRSTTPFFQPRTWYSNARRMSSRGRSNSGELSTGNTIRDGWWFTRSSDTMIYGHVSTSWNLCNLRGFSYCVSRDSEISTFWVL